MIVSGDPRIGHRLLKIRLLRDVPDVVCSPEGFVGPCGDDLHVVAGLWVKEVGRAPLVDKFVAIERATIVSDKDDLIRVLAEELLGDFKVLHANGVSFVGESIMADELIDQCECLIGSPRFVERATGFDRWIIIHAAVSEASEPRVVGLWNVV